MDTSTRRGLQVRLSLFGHRLAEQLRRGGENPLFSPPDPFDPDFVLSVHERDRLLRKGRRSGTR